MKIGGIGDLFYSGESRFHRDCAIMDVVRRLLRRLNLPPATARPLYLQ
jgi:hypothetical protein